MSRDETSIDWVRVRAACHSQLRKRGIVDDDSTSEAVLMVLLAVRRLGTDQLPLHIWRAAADVGRGRSASHVRQAGYVDAMDNSYLRRKVDEEQVIEREQHRLAALLATV